MSFFSAIAGAFKKAVPAIIKGIKRGGGKMLKGLKSTGERIVKGVKRGTRAVKNLFQKKVKPWKEGDPPRGFVNVGGGKMAYKGGKPVTGKVIRDRGLGDRIKVKGEGSKTFSYIDNLTDPESILL
jgi:hypothetical protein